MRFKGNVLKGNHLSQTQSNLNAKQKASLRPETRQGCPHSSLLYNLVLQVWPKQLNIFSISSNHTTEEKCIFTILDWGENPQEWTMTTKTIFK